MSGTVLVTGASSGIGKATAEHLLDEGYAVYVAARRVERLRELEERGATALAMDITRDDDKTRYAAGRLAKPLLWVRKWLGDRVFDRAIMSQV